MQSVINPSLDWLHLRCWWQSSCITRKQYSGKVATLGFHQKDHEIVIPVLAVCSNHRDTFGMSSRKGVGSCSDAVGKVMQLDQKSRV